MFTSLFPLSRRQAVGRGALALVLGVVFVVWPGITISTAVLLFAVYSVIDAGMLFAGALAKGESPGLRALRLLLGAVDVAAAAVAIIYPGPTAEVLVIVVGVWAIFGGLAELWSGFSVSSGWLGITGLLSIVAGIMLVAWPDIGAVTLALIFGIYLATYGAVLLVGGLSRTNASRDRASTGPAAA